MLFRSKEEAGGGKPHGKHALKNNGVSFIRSGRELEINKSWNNPSESRWRWVNAEIHFEGDQDMDNFLKVPTNKQGADNLYYRDIKKECDERNMNEPQYMSYLQETDIEEYVGTIISNKIKNRLNEMVKTVKEWRKSKGPVPPITGSPEDTTTKYRENRKNKTIQDKEKDKSTKELRLKTMMERLVASGMEEKEAKDMAAMSVDRDISTIITAEEINSPVFFDISFKEGQYQIIINKSHPAYLDFFNLLEKENDGKSVDEPSSDRAIKLMLTAWAALKDESSTSNYEYVNHLDDIKLRWGQIIRDLLSLK